VQKALFDPKFDELADQFVGGWKGLKSGLKKFGENFSRSLKDIFIPFYGVFGGPGNPKNEKEVYDPDVHGYDDTDERYTTHDRAYRDPLKNRRSIRDADWALERIACFSAAGASGGHSFRPDVSAGGQESAASTSFLRSLFSAAPPQLGPSISKYENDNAKPDLSNDSFAYMLHFYRCANRLSVW
jgi:hypothetical protein